jgi:succinyl-CoA:(S)-malate CoA-transferase subunit A/succinyl-CoA:(S)-malate CoA-transferase subunit B
VGVGSGDTRKAGGALDDVRVLDLGIFLAGPFCATLLGEFGAEVIKVERPASGDPFRSVGGSESMVDGANLWWLQENRNKKSISCDLSNPKGQALVKKLAARSDVLVENFMPGVLERWGLGYEALRAVNRRLIMVRISGYGQTGPNRDQPGFARVAQAYAGLTYLTGEPDGPPLTPGSTSLADYCAGLFGALGALIALHHRDRGGEGQMIDIGLYESIFRLMDTLAVNYGTKGITRERLGRFTTLQAPHGQYPTKDRKWITLACNTNQQFRALVEALGAGYLADDPRFASPPVRADHRVELNPIIEELCRQRDLEELLETLRRKSIPGGPVNSIEEIFADPHFWERGNLVEMAHEVVGRMVLPGPIPHLSATPAVPGQFPQLEIGADNQEVYAGLLGVDAAEMEQLQAEGVI